MEPGADVVLVGFGGAGAAAALSARHSGLTALLIEKQQSDRHTPSTRMSGGLIMAADDEDGAARYLDHSAGGMVPATGP